MDHSDTSLTNFYNGQTVFLTGGTGMVGMALLSRLVLDTPVSCIYALARGGEKHFWDVLDSQLPTELIKELQLSEKLIILDGDITLPDCGLQKDTLETIRQSVSIFIHGASTINLKKNLTYMAERIVHPSLAIARLALTCTNLTRFVYISTAFENSFLPHNSDGSVTGFDATIKEEVRPIRSDPLTNLDTELSGLAASGDTPEFNVVRHPFAYSYAKHLAERLILREFEAPGLSNKLLVLRPSIIGPAETKPFPFYEKPGSAPATICAVAAILSPPTTLPFSSHLADPSMSTVDEVPVDVVVNRLIVHCALGTSGPVHAVAGERNRLTMERAWECMTSLRRFWWGRPRIAWRNCHWKSSELSQVARLFVLFGCSFTFDQTKTQLVWEGMSETDRENWPLWMIMNADLKERIPGRAKVLRFLVGQYLVQKWGLPAFLASLLMRADPTHVK